MIDEARDDFHVTKIEFRMTVDGRERSVVFLRKEKIDALMRAEDETLGSWLRAVATTAEDGSLDEWLKLYTWVQGDGTMNFSHPRRRPRGLAVDPRELGSGLTYTRSPE